MGNSCIDQCGLPTNYIITNSSFLPTKQNDFNSEREDHGDEIIKIGTKSRDLTDEIAENIAKLKQGFNKSTSDKSIKLPEKDFDKSSIVPQFKTDPIIIHEIGKENSHLPVKNLIEEDFKWLKEYFVSHYIFKYLSEDNINNIIKNIKKISIKENHIIRDFSFTSTNLCIIRSGNINLKINDKNADPNFSIQDLHLKTISSKSYLDGDLIGEDSLVDLSLKYSKEIFSVVNTEMYIINKELLKKINHEYNNILVPLKKRFLLMIGLFRGLSATQIDFLANEIIVKEYENGDQICEGRIINEIENQYSNYIYVIKQGEVMIYINSVFIRCLNFSNHFGDIEILRNVPFRCNIFAKGHVVLFAVPLDKIELILGYNFRLEMVKSYVSYLIKKSSVLKDIYLEKLLSQDYFFDLKYYKYNQTIIHKNTNFLNDLIFVISGNICKVEIICGKGNVLFETPIIHNIPLKLNSDLVANPDCLFVKINISDLEKEFSDLKDLILLKIKLSLLKNVYFFSFFTDHILLQLVEKIIVEIYDKNATIIEDKKPLDKLLIVQSGSILLFKPNNTTRLINSDGYIGEKALFNYPQKVTLCAKDDVILLSLTKEKFEDFLGKNETLYSYFIQSIYLNCKIDMKEFVVTGKTNEDKFSKTYKLKNIKSQNYFNLKVFPKRKIVGLNLNQETKIMIGLDHPFILKVNQTFEDINLLYYLTEYCTYKTISDLISMYDLKIDNEFSKYLLASVLTAVEYLHNKNIIYRSFSPENIGITNKGVVKLVSFSNAKIIKDFTNTCLDIYLRYSSPEVILGKNYSYYSDLWSLGVFLYEIYYGKNPFYDRDDPLSLFKSILIKDITFPENLKNEQLESLLQSLLEKKLYKRLININLVKNHEWFDEFNWNDLILMKMKSPFIPKIPKLDSKEENLIEYNTFIAYVQKEEEKFQVNSVEALDKYYNEF